MVIDLRPVLLWLRWTKLWAASAVGTAVLLFLAFGDSPFHENAPYRSDSGEGVMIWLLWHLVMSLYLTLSYLWWRVIPVGAVEGLLVLVCMRLRWRRLLLFALFYPLLWEIGDDFSRGWFKSDYIYRFGFLEAQNWWVGLRTVLPTALGYLLPAVVSGVVVYWLGIRSLRIDGAVETASLENPSGGSPDPPVA
jgi:hypothetical protein